MDVLNISVSDLRRYRDFVSTVVFYSRNSSNNIMKKTFPKELASGAHEPFFSLEEPEAWARIESVQKYLQFVDTDASLLDGPGRSNATISDLKVYRQFVSIANLTRYKLFNDTFIGSSTLSCITSIFYLG